MKINQQQIDAILELRNLCFFETIKERKAFLTKVSYSVGVSKIEEIDEKMYQKAFGTAKSILHKRGELVFRAQKNICSSIQNNYFNEGE